MCNFDHSLFFYQAPELVQFFFNLIVSSVPSKDVNGMNNFQPYSNSIWSGMVFIRLYPISSI